AAKAAVDNFTRSLALELGPDGIRVNSVAPDFIPTPNMSHLVGGGSEVGMPAALSSTISIPLGRPGLPREVSACVAVLGSPPASYITGSTLRPDGGTWASAGFFNWPGAGWDNFIPNPIVDRIEDLAARPN